MTDLGPQTLKTREDVAPIILEPTGNATPTFKLTDGHSCSWLKVGKNASVEELRQRIEPWLTALFQSEHLALLVGSGLTHAVHWAAAGKDLPGMSEATFSVFADQIASEKTRIAKQAGRGGGNIEDQFRVVHELVRGLEIIAITLDPSNKTHAQLASLKEELADALQNFAKSIFDGEEGIQRAEAKEREAAFHLLVSFLMSFASRAGTRDRLNLFTTNYDRLLEAGADLAGLRLIDRFAGNLSPLFRSSRLDIDMHYSPPGIRGEPRHLEGVAKFTKLHGSIDWFEENGEITRLGIPFGDAPFWEFYSDKRKGAALKMMIYPNTAKDIETAAYPYVELFRDLAAAVCRPNSTAVTYGYSFGDDHINRVLRDMLTIPSTHLVIIARDDTLGRIMNFYEKSGRGAQISLLIGHHLGDLNALVNHYLPKPAIDRTTIRMADLLKARFGTGPEKEPPAAGTTTGESTP